MTAFEFERAGLRVSSAALQVAEDLRLTIRGVRRRMSGSPAADVYEAIVSEMRVKYPDFSADESKLRPLAEGISQASSSRHGLALVRPQT